MRENRGPPPRRSKTISKIFCNCPGAGLSSSVRQIFLDNGITFRFKEPCDSQSEPTREDQLALALSSRAGPRNQRRHVVDREICRSRVEAGLG
jgi:hypothetical protein